MLASKEKANKMFDRNKPKKTTVSDNDRITTPTTGIWKQDFENGIGVSICSLCGRKIYIPEVDYRYCPYCGNPME